MERQRVSLFIDLNNVEESMAQYSTKGMYLDYSDMVRILVGDDELVRVRVYDSIPNRNPELEALHESLRSNGFEVVEKRPQAAENNLNTVCVQKEVDTSLVVDMVGLAAQDDFDKAIVVSGDRDMRPAVEWIENMGKTAVVAGFHDTLCTEFRDERDNTVVIDDMFVIKFARGKAYDNHPNHASGSIFEEAVIDA